MPELPEVQTTVDGLNKELKNLKITDVWTDYKSLFHTGKNNIKNPEYFPQFKKDVVGSKITKASRAGKNVLIHLGNGKTILTHMKMTGHYIYGSYFLEGKTWKPKEKTGPLTDPYNRHIHLVFTLSNKKHLVFCDTRTFAKIFIFDTENEKTIADLMDLGPDPLSDQFTYEVFKNQILKRPNAPIKQVLLDQELIAGIGNIYSDEILFAAGLHPLSKVSKIPEKNLKAMYRAAKIVLARGIDFGGDSTSDYRNIYGLPGQFQNKHQAYRHTGQPCSKKDGGTIERLKVGGRSAHFCPKHQIKF